MTALLFAVVLLQIEQPDAGATRPPPEQPPARPTAPGEPTVDNTLPTGTLIVELRDSQRRPMAKAKVFIESAGQANRGRRLEAETDDVGQLHVEDLPVGDTAAIVIGYEGSSGVLTSTSPFGLPTEGGTRVLLVAPDRTGDRSSVSLEQLHVVLEREGQQLRVTETLGLAAAAGAIFSDEKGLALPLPSGASGFRFADAEKTAKMARLDGDEVVITAPISPGGIELTIVFDVPIDGGRAELDQEIPLPVGAVQVISTWTQGDAKLTVAGFSEAEPAELRSGLTALVAATKSLPGGRLKLTLAGIADGPDAVRRTLTLVASIVVLGFGLVLWILGRVRRKSKGGDDD
ncbi:MAG: hypothetical protein JRF63_06370 [Deltaproteobacteria bacterium]|nr:hypothetical protein [Deltaproteobacteria bacterium]